MLVPLFVLALLALIGGFDFFAGRFLFIPRERETTVLVPALALIAMLTGLTAASYLYRRRTAEPLWIEPLRRKLYIDEFYDWFINVTQEVLARVAAFIDRWIIDVGVVRSASGTTWGFGALLRLMQVGNLQAYAFIFGLGIIWVIYFAIFR